MNIPPRQFTSLKSVCESQGTPYFEACFDEGHPGLIRNKLGSSELWDVRLPYIYCGLARDIVIFGPGLIYTKDKAFVFHCQSYSNNIGHGEFEKQASTVIDCRQDNFENYVEQECIFVGGLWVVPDEAGVIPPGNPNFGHFVFEFLNRLAIYDLYGLNNLPVVIYENVPESWIGFLELAGIPRERLIRVSPVRPPAYRRVWISSAPHYRDQHGNVRFWGAGLHWLRSRLLSAIGGPRAKIPTRLYLSRRDAAYRKVVNDGEVTRLLEEYGFESPPVSAMSPREQIELVSGAELIIVAAGAGSIITQFAPEHCIILLLAAEQKATGVWGGLGQAMVLRQLHDRIDCSVDETEPQKKALDSNYRVDLDTLRAKVEQALAVIQSSQMRDATRL